MNNDCKYVYSHDIYHNCDKVSADCDIGFNTKEQCWEHEIHRLEKEVNKLNKSIIKNTAIRNSYLDNIEKISELLKCKNG